MQFKVNLGLLEFSVEKWNMFIYAFNQAIPQDDFKKINWQTTSVAFKLSTLVMFTSEELNQIKGKFWKGMQGCIAHILNPGII